VEPAALGALKEGPLPLEDSPKAFSVVVEACLHSLGDPWELEVGLVVALVAQLALWDSWAALEAAMDDPQEELALVDQPLAWLARLLQEAPAAVDQPLACWLGSCWSLPHISLGCLSPSQQAPAAGEPMAHPLPLAHQLLGVGRERSHQE
jgi:hypothetical protein